MNDVLKDKLKQLPPSPGVYFHKNQNGEIIYIGKAAILKNRVRQYFQNNKSRFDAKTLALVEEIYDTDWIQTDSELDALFFEAEMVKRYMPRYNILLRDDKSLVYIRIDIKSQWPTVTFTRNPLDDNAEYYGPFYNGFAVKKALRYLRKVFPYYTIAPKQNGKLGLDDHLGLSPVKMTSAQYKNNLRKIISYINGGRKKIVSGLEKEMLDYAKRHNFEQAAVIRNQLRYLAELQNKIYFGDKEFLDISKDQALTDIKELLGMPNIPSRIEGYDISHMSGTNVVASMVVFKNGVSSRSDYRKFKIRVDKNNDFLNMQEVITRRFSEKNIKQWGLPDLILIDGGKGQLGSVNEILSGSLVGNNKKINIIGLAKKQEQLIIGRNQKYDSEKVKKMGGLIIQTDDFSQINLPDSSHVVKLLQRIRDESHRFAVSYHTVIKRSKQTASVLDDIPGIGSKTKSKLIRKFGSINAIKKASQSQIADVVGMAKARVISNYFSL